MKVYIEQNFDGLKEALALMLGNGRCKINTQKFQNDMTTLETSEAFIPNQEIAQEFLNVAEGINYDKQSKKHQYIIERFTKE